MENKVRFYQASPAFETVMAILIGLGVCLTRLSTAVSQISLVLATLTGFYLWWKNGKRLELNPLAKKYMKVVGIFFAAALFSVIDVDNKAATFRYFFGDWIWRFMVFILIVAFVRQKEYFCLLYTSPSPRD